MWKTGAAAYDAQAKTELGLTPQDHIVAFLYLGTTALPEPQRPRLSTASSPGSK
jgi:hypothetical protein